jgi:hypothetical protein
MAINPRRRETLLFGFLAVISLTAYLASSRLTYRVGFPLDDAWIHQTYARNLALKGEWAFQPGQPSAGSTSPLWSAILAIGYWLGAGPYIWTFLLGWGILFAIVIIGRWVFQLLCPDWPGWWFWAGLLLCFEWHIVWAAGSGMETLLFAFLALLVLARILDGRGNWFATGLLIGLSAWVRPDGVTLIGPALMAMFLSRGKWSEKLIQSGKVLLGALLLFTPFLIFNRILAGAWWPNTFYAKQAEYAILRQSSILERFANQFSLPVVGVGAILLPGLLFFTWKLLRQNLWSALSAELWMLGYLFLYAWRLPVVYQHGRYVIPAMPVFFLYGLAGLAEGLRPNSWDFWQRIIGKAWLFSAALVLVVFWLIGARTYGNDVAFIDSEMVQVAQWVAKDTPRDALIAAHDIGALGYFGQRHLLDLAGLISPEVIPFIRDEDRLRAYLDYERADYLVTFPGWYPDLVKGAQPVFVSSSAFFYVNQDEHMVVYHWNPP